ncbi:MAG TPA: GNAT family N-acetyltransferase [Alphaproteobacteria bacterium]|jgi:ribosomal protein S18 acetylase RimI-like enzyme|nr:GNAT family N-acetyltransferase [Alphaproteobacteria bacterium]HBA43503.1 GNAT family N-acetyltransferase [Alphaproteobacteria bacterium]
MAQTDSSAPARKPRRANVQIDRLDELAGTDLADLCEITAEAIIDGEGFLWIKVPPLRVLENYWKGVLLVPERSLYVGRLDGRIVGTAQLYHPSHNNEAGAFAVELTTFFIAPWARGHGVARGILKRLFREARQRGYKNIDLHVRADRSAAIALFEAHGFECWGEKPRYARLKGRYIGGRYYTKQLG